MSKTLLESRLPKGFLSGAAKEVGLEEEYQVRKPKRRGPLLIVLFVLTLLSTTWVGTTAWSPLSVILTSLTDSSLILARSLILENWACALGFSLSLMAILTAHELGHYVMTRIYGIRATPPIFIPFPFAPIGTAGALIAMEGGSANRKEMFDIGIAGPLAGMMVAIPILFLGLQTDLRPSFPVEGNFSIGKPLLIQLIGDWFNPAALQASNAMSNYNLNPFIMAAWAGFLVTGLNMMPMSQLDGGHVTFGLLGEKAVYLAYAVFGTCIAFMIYFQEFSFVLMLGLVMLIGLRHPPSRDDTVPLGFGRHLLGWMSLMLPILCIPPVPIHF